MSTDLPEITERRQLVATASPSIVQFSAHFKADQWAEFQKLVSP